MRTPLQNRWKGMKDRCNNPNHISYKNYGGRGIKVCEEWQSFDAFKTWAIKSGYKRELTLDRIDVNGNYEPSNCRWVSRKVQAVNRRNNRIISVDGEAKTLSEWAEESGICQTTIRGRIEYGWDVEQAVKSKPQKHPTLTLTLNEETHTVNEWVKITGLSKATIYGRIKSGWSVEDTLTAPRRVITERGYNYYSLSRM